MADVVRPPPPPPGAAHVRRRRGKWYEAALAAALRTAALDESAHLVRVHAAGCEAGERCGCRPLELRTGARA